MAQLKDLIVNGASRFIGDIFGTNATLSGNVLPTTDNTQYLGDSTHKWKVVGSLTGNADTATALTSSAGGVRNPVYFSNGKPVAGEVTFDSLTANRLVWTSAANKLYAGYHFASATQIGICETSVTSGIAFEVDGKAHITSTASNGLTDTPPAFTVGTLTDKHIGIARGGIQAKANATTATTLNLNYYGGGVQIGSSSYASNTTIYGTSYLTGVTTHGGDVVSDTHATDSLGTTSVRWKYGYFSSALYVGAANTSGASVTGGSANAIGSAKVICNSADEVDRGFYLRNRNVNYAYLYIDTLGTAAVLDSSTSTYSNTTGQTRLVIGNNKQGISGSSASVANNSAGLIFLYSNGTGSHIIRGSNIDSNCHHYFPNQTGWIATGGNGISTGVGGADQIVYLSTAGVLTAGTSATDANAASTIVKRDSSGNFSAGTITATLNGNATSANCAHLPANTNGVAYYINTSGQFGNIRAASGAFYSTGQDVKPTFGTLPTAQGGTGSTSYAANKIIYAYTATKLESYTSTRGGTAKLWYLNAGVPTDSSATVGSASTPVYLNAGTITACTQAMPTYNIHDYYELSASSLAIPWDNGWTLAVYDPILQSNFINLDGAYNTNKISMNIYCNGILLTPGEHYKNNYSVSGSALSGEITYFFEPKVGYEFEFVYTTSDTAIPTLITNLEL